MSLRCSLKLQGWSRTAARRSRWLDSLIGTLQPVLIENGGKGHAGRFLWTDDWLKDLTPEEKSWHISDHYQLWVEFSIPGA